MRPWMERELQSPGRVVNAITRFLVITVDVCEPAYATSRYLLQILAVLVEDIVIFLYKQKTG